MVTNAACERAPYAADPRTSRGRLHPDLPSASRNAFRRDCDRVIHSTAFRRLQYKTQVFLFDEGDHYRTRLTHTLEVAQIARALARVLRLDEDLAEALALAHDLGHPPFGHAGERALDACLSAYGGFDHNAQTLRVVTLMERRYPDFDGLNLTWETLEGIVKHNGPLVARDGAPVGRYRGRGVPAPIRDYSAMHDLMLWSQPGAEAQVAGIADDIAYGAHDIDDGLRAGLFAREELGAVQLLAEILDEVGARHPGLEPHRINSTVIRRLIAKLIDGVVAESTRRIAQVAPRSPEAVRTADAPIVAFPAALAQADRDIKAFLHSRVYRHTRVMRIMTAAERAVRELFAYYLDRPDEMPIEWALGLDSSDIGARARRIADFIAGMTDRYALAEHARHFRSTPELA